MCGKVMRLIVTILLLIVLPGMLFGCGNLTNTAVDDSIKIETAARYYEIPTDDAKPEKEHTVVIDTSSELSTTETITLSTETEMTAQTEIVNTKTEDSTAIEAVNSIVPDDTVTDTPAIAPYEENETAEEVPVITEIERHTSAVDDIPDNPDTVYWTESGEVWHITRECPSLSRSKNIMSGTVEQSCKIRACKRCS